MSTASTSSASPSAAVDVGSGFELAFHLSPAKRCANTAVLAAFRNASSGLALPCTRMVFRIAASS